ncbi:hypothetical protein CV102_15235 [Natronococcus pandeyae]|uniref:Uncharacterized protein n=1 Tax=Natronococcus pandeyae TaxID=2055836 RepID=A0A8J8TRG8_9EURY|nr:hypothetical protein [Natronococcus pandeyae]TYL37689.1 hypothetical protein CV102_15235 [Natronococcus pandeyae]
MLGSSSTEGTDRGQAYTLEGFIGAMVVLMAVLLALQSVVIMPTTSGTADRAVQNQLQQETKDALVVAAQDGGLSETIRSWDEDANDGEGGFHNASQPGPDGERTYDVGSFANQSTLGEILESRFAEKGHSYNVELVANDGEEFNATRMVYQGSAPPDAFTASYTVTLFEDDILTAPENRDQQIELKDEDGNVHDDEEYEYPIAPAEGSDGPVYTVVEVRVTVW